MYDYLKRFPPVFSKSVYQHLQYTGILAVHEKSVDTLEWSKTGTHLLSASGDGKVAIWNLETFTNQGSNSNNVIKRPSKSITTGHKKNNYATRWLGAGDTPDRIVTGSGDGECRVFAAASSLNQNARTSTRFSMEHVLDKGRQSSIKSIDVDKTRPDAVFRSANGHGKIWSMTCATVP